MIAAIVGALLARDSNPVLWRAPFSINQLSGEDHNYVLFNPFRDRSPERVADAYLEAMRRGSCTDAEKLTINIVLPNRLTCEQIQAEYRKVRNLFVCNDYGIAGRTAVLLFCTTQTLGMRATGCLSGSPGENGEAIGESSNSIRSGSAKSKADEKSPLHSLTPPPRTLESNSHPRSSDTL